MLSLLIFLPLAIAFVVTLTPPLERTFRAVTVGTAILQLIILILIYLNFDFGKSFQHVEKYQWINFSMSTWGNFTAYYWLGVDGLSFPLLFLSTIVFAIASLASANIKHNVKGYFILLLILNGAVMGTFAAMDTLLFFVFFEFMLIPMYFLIGIWGGTKREYASIKFFLYTLLGSIFILVGIIVIYTSVQDPDVITTIDHTFGITHLVNSENYIVGSILHPDTQTTLGWFSWREWVFLLLFFGFAIKIPIVPFHTWLPDAHVEASTPISMILAALLLKVGAYGLIRFAYNIFPIEASHFAYLSGVLALISIIYGALNALASKDLKRLIAYSSVSHMGFVLLGLTSGTSEGITGSVFQMISHGLIATMLFSIAGILYDRTNDRTISNYSGLFNIAPNYTAFVLVSFFAGMGIPGFSSFIGEIMVLFGSFSSQFQNGLIPIWIPILGVFGILLAAGYFVWTIQRMFFGKLYIGNNIPFNDISLREWFILTPLSALILLLGVYPQPLLDLINPYAHYLSELLSTISQ